MLKVLRAAALVVVGLAVLLLAVVGALTLLRSSPTARVTSIGDTPGTLAAHSREFARTAGLLTGVQLLPGNVLEVLSNGRGTFPPLWRDLRAARVSITAQLYYITPGAVLDSLVAALRERAAGGVLVHFLYDDVGAAVPDAVLTALRGSGVQVAVFRPVRWYDLQKAQNRSHARTIVIDGKLGYTGGFGIDDRWQGDGLAAKEWRDTNVRFTGPAVAELQAAFVTAWAEATHQLLIGASYFPELEPVSPASVAADPIPAALAGVLHSVAAPGHTRAQQLIALTAAAARERMYITNAYFVPDDALLGMLAGAARRGVDVRLLLPGRFTDVPLTRAAARARYERLLRAGVRVWEYTPSMMHAKTFVVDGHWVSVGTLNLDARSFIHNDEVTLLAWDRDVGAALDSLFLADLTHAREIRLEEFLRRPWHHRVGEVFARQFTKIL